MDHEARLLSQVSHPNIIRCIGYFWDKFSLFIVLEWAELGDLQNLIHCASSRNRYLPESLIWDIFFQLCCAVNHLHENRILHRDIKPLNIFLKPNTSPDLLNDEINGSTLQVLLGDFGISRILTDSVVTSFHGTPLYVAPEVCEEKPYDQRVDMWCVFLHSLFSAFLLFISMHICLISLISLMRLDLWNLQKKKKYIFIF